MLEITGEGYPLAGGMAEHACPRPGCYERFVPTSRSPLQSFCSAGCRQALRRVLVVATVAAKTGTDAERTLPRRRFLVASFFLVGGVLALRLSGA